ncbi:hypothetical protein Droror1_Dr00008539 [Drosera rotundifolia]
MEEPPVEELKKAVDIASKEDIVNEVEDLGSDDETHKAAMSKGTCAGEDPDEYAMTIEVPKPSNDGSIQVASITGHVDDKVEDETHDEPMS